MALAKGYPMTDIIYILSSVGFFVLMLLFMWACEKI